MECKFIRSPLSLKQCIELIDTLWNVNFLLFSLLSFLFPELIDTLWNVNNENTYKHSHKVNELIDTLWNVNL